MAQLLILERETLNNSQSLFIDGRPEIIDLRQSFVVVAILLESQSTLFFLKQCSPYIFLFLNGHCRLFIDDALCLLASARS